MLKIFSGSLLPVCLLIILFFPSPGFSDTTQNYQKAQQASAQGDFKTAQIHLKNILQEQPDNLQARIALADVYIHTGDGVAAEILLKKLIQQGVDDPEIQVMWVKANLVQGKFKHVTDQISNITRLPPNYIGRIRALQGQAYLNQNKLTPAKSFFVRASKLAPDSLEVKTGLARLYELNKETDKSNSLIKDLYEQYPYEADVLLLMGNMYRNNKQYDRAVEIYDKLRTQQPGNLAAWLGLVESLIANNEFEQANQYIGQVLKQDPEHELANHLQAIIAYQLKQYATAEQSLRIIEKNDPDNKSILWLSGALDFQQQRYGKAEEKLEEFLKLYPEHLKASKTLAAIYLKRKQGYRAVQLLKHFEKVENANLFALLGSAYILAGNQSKGTYYLERAADLSPQNKAIQHQLQLVKVTTGKENELTFEDPDYSNFSGIGIIHVLSLLKQNRADDAILVLEKYQEKNEHNAQISNLLGSAYLQKQDNKKARQLFEQAINEARQFVLPRINLARLDVQEKDFESAKKRYFALLEKQPEDVTVLIDLARLSQLENDKKSMIRWLKQAAKLNKSAVEPRLLLNQYYYGLKKFDKALLLTQELIDLQPENSRFLKLHADNLLASGQLFESIGVYKKITQLHPQSPIVWRWLASVQYLQKNYKAAENSFQKVLVLQPDNVIAGAAMVQLKLRKKQLDMAKEYAEKLLAAHPKLPLAYESYADVAVMQHQFNEALKFYKKSQEIKPSPEVAVKIYKTWRIMGKPETGEKVLEDWLVKNPDDLKIRMMLAVIYQVQNKLEKAQKHYEYIVKKQPENISAINNLALIYDQTNDPRNIEFAEIAYSLAPDRANINDTLGWILLKSGDIERALKLLEFAVRADPANFNIIYHYAAALYENNYKKEAKRQLYMIVPVNKNFTERKEAEKLLEKVKNELK